MIKYTEVYPYHRILFSKKKRWTSDTCNKMHESPDNYTEWKKLIPKGYILYPAIYITFLKSQRYRNEEEITHCQGLRWGWEQEELECDNVKDLLVDGNVLSLAFTKVSISWLWYCSIELREVTFGENWVKIIQNLYALFLIITHESIIISK